MKYTQLYGEDVRRDTAAIRQALNEDGDAVFIYTGTGTLHDYISGLDQRGRGLGGEYLYRFRVCYEKKGLHVSYQAETDAEEKPLSTMSELLGELDGETPCRIIVEQDDRAMLSEIVQQLIYIGYPLEKTEILLRREAGGAEKIRRFMARVEELAGSCEQAASALKDLSIQVMQEPEDEDREERLQDITSALDSCRTIQERLSDAMAVELKVAIASSKESGKSEMVNCFLGGGIAPTGIEHSTPNNCVFRRSADGQYALQLDGEEGCVPFRTREELHDAMEARFREARNDWESGLMLPDMNVRYVTKENNFSAYTIYDAAGPDAVGTEHEQGALKALRACDAAVFAIDYGKLLTRSEEAYLREIKDIFTFRNKCQSLVFALNKIDIRYTDGNVPKSFIMAADFVKTRLAELGAGYQDCIVFPTSAREYTCAMGAEQANVVELKHGAAAGEMGRITSDRRDVPELKWLHGHSEYLDYYHGLKTVSCDIFQKDSGMPALMNYISYAVRSKVREELVDSITAQIAAQEARLREVLDSIQSLESLIREDEEQISYLTQVITDYIASVNAILTENCNENDLAVLERVNMLGQFGGVYQNIVVGQDEAIKTACEEAALTEHIYSQVADSIWERLSGKLQAEGTITGQEINGLFTSRDFNAVVNSVVESEATRNGAEIRCCLDQILHETEQVAAYRRDQFLQACQKCWSAMSEEDVEIQVPDPPALAFSTRLNVPEKIPADMYQANLNLFHDLGFLFKKKFFSNIGVWFSGLFRSRKAAREDYKLVLNADSAEFRAACEKYLRPDIVNAIYTDGISDKIYQLLKVSLVDQYMSGLVNELQRGFRTVNETYQDYGERFLAAIDDRDDYREDIALHEEREELIRKIEEATASFMERWDEIAGESAEAALNQYVHT